MEVSLVPNKNSQSVMSKLPDTIMHHNILPRLPAGSLLRFKCVSKNINTLINSSPFINVAIIHHNILPRLPAKSLLRFKCVSKDWYTLINSLTFIELHLKYTLESFDFNDFLVGFSNDYRQTTKFEYTYINPPYFTSGSQVVFYLTDIYNCSIAAVGSCNGLVCLNLVSEIMLCNPVTREYRILIDSRKQNSYQIYGFGYDCESHAYKIVKITNDLDEYDDHWDDPIGGIVEVYNTNTNSWKKVSDFPPSLYVQQLQGGGVAFNNRLHFILVRPNQENVIVTFDLHTEELEEMTYPMKIKKHYGDKLSLIVSNGCLYTVVYPDMKARVPEISIWVMKEYGIGESWTKLHELVGSEFSYLGAQVITYRSGREGGEVLLEKGVDNELAWYNIEDKSFRKVNVRGESKDLQNVLMCVGSLVRVPRLS